MLCNVLLYIVSYITYKSICKCILIASDTDVYELIFTLLHFEIGQYVMRLIMFTGGRNVMFASLVMLRIEDVDA